MLLSRRMHILAVASVLLFVAVAPGFGSATRAGAASKASSSARAKKSSSNVANIALIEGEEFSWMLPLENEDNYEPWDWEFEEGSWAPLYSVGQGNKVGIEYTASIGKRPVYSDGDTTVTITLNTDFTWSDGQKVTSTDIKFFFELEDAGKATLGDYLPGELPDDIKSVTYPGPETVVLHLVGAYNPTWFTSNQLTWIFPLPAQAWDKTCATCAVGNAATTPAGAKRVFDFLFAQSKDLRTYATNALWKTVDGPWVISSYDAVTYATSFTANDHYTGPDKPKLAGFNVYSYTTSTAELDALRSGTVTFGYIPLTDVSETSYFKSHGYTVKAWKYFYNEGMEFGYTSKTYGPLVKQLYIRQALQHLVTEKLYISKTLGGYGVPSYGPVDDYPGSSYVSPTLRKDPYPYSLSAAKKLLTDHGWKVGASTDVCERPGTAARECGAGIAKGASLSLAFYYENGTTSFTNQVTAFATAAKKVGIDITVEGKTEDTMYSVAGVCPKTPPCNYGLAGYADYLWDYGQYYSVPTGDDQFGKGNFWAGGYTTVTAQTLIDAADQGAGTGLKALYADENYLSKDVAALWWPVADSIVAVKSNLKGWYLNPFGTTFPSTWYFSK